MKKFLASLFVLSALCSFSVVSVFAASTAVISPTDEPPTIP